MAKHFKRQTYHKLCVFGFMPYQLHRCIHRQCAARKAEKHKRLFGDSAVIFNGGTFIFHGNRNACNSKQEVINKEYCKKNFHQTNSGRNIFMKRIIPFFLIISVLLTSCQHQSNIENPESEIKAVWISCYDYICASGKTADEYKAITDEMFSNIAGKGLNTAFVHLRAFCDSFYQSDIFPYSEYIAGTQGGMLAFDPFEILLASAEKYNIEIHAWINPFRISYSTDISLLCDSSPAKKLIEQGNQNGEICVLESGIYLNPASPQAQKIVFDGIREILGKYQLSGIHIDDYFYPSTDEEIDKNQYSYYLASGGRLPLNEWRRENVNAFVAAMYSLIKSYGENITVSISPSGDIESNLNKHFADVALWLSQKGYADMIIPQIYFGFEHETQPFETLLHEWGKLKRNKNTVLLCGIAAYKSGKKDEYAGKGKNEWSENSDVVDRQIEAVRSNPNYGGYALFSYSDIVGK